MRSGPARRLARGAPALAAVVARVVVGVACGMGGGCVFDARTPADAQISCGGDEDCPDGRVCSAFLQVCVEASGDREAPALVSSSLSAARLGPLDVLVVTLETSERATAASLLQVGALQAPLEQEDDDGRAFRAQVSAAALASGVFAVSAVLVDEVGNAGASVLGTVEVDVSAPGVVSDSVVVTIEPPEGVTPTEDPALVVGGGIRARFRLDDLAADTLSVSVRTADVLALALSRTTRDGIDFIYDGTLAAAADAGDYDVVAELTDDVGNVARVVLATVRVADVVAAVCLALREDGTPVCTDADGDGAFAPGTGCAPGEATDCDDTRPMVRPGAVDLPDNGIDDDCDGAQASFDDPTLLARSIFVAPGAPGNAAGTREEPLGSLLAAFSRAAQVPGGEGLVFAQAGAYVANASVRELSGSLVGGLDDTWTTRVGLTTIEGGDSVGLRLLGVGPTIVSGVELRGILCHGVSNDVTTDAALWVEDVHVVSNDSDSCAQRNAFYLYSRPAQLHGSSATMRRELAYGDLNGVRADELFMTDTTVDIRCTSCTATGVNGDTGIVARSRVTLEGDSPIGLIGDRIGVHTSSFDIGAVADSYWGPVALQLSQADAVHNTLSLEGASGIGVSAGAGLIASNELVVSGAGSVGVRIEDYGYGGPALHGNAFDVTDSCALRFGREDLTCLPLEPCPQCASASANASAPDVPPEINVIDLGASSAVALTLDGVCRGSTSPPGAGGDAQP